MWMAATSRRVRRSTAAFWINSISKRNRASKRMFARTSRGSTRRRLFHGFVREPVCPVVRDLELGLIEDFSGDGKIVLKRREQGVALDLALDQREVEVAAERQCLLV